MVQQEVRTIAWTLLLSLAACGGGGSGDGTPPPPFTATPQAGTLDPSFGNAGSVTAPLSVISEMKVDAAGNAYLGSSLNSFIVKFSPDGSPAGGYGEAGRAAIPASALAFDPNGDLYAAAGESIARVDASGRLSSAFGNGGRASLQPFAGNLYVLLRDAAANLQVVGSAFVGGSVQQPFVAKVDSEGRLATSFGQGGGRLLEIEGGISYGIGAARESSGAIVLVGRASSSQRVFALKIDSAGNRVTDYGSGGLWQSDACADNEQGPGIAIDANDNAYIVARCGASARIFKLDSAGMPVSAFGEMGVKSDFFEDVRSQPSGAGAVAIDPAGNLYVAGTLGECGDLAVAKMNPGGQLLGGFGTGGRAVFDLGGRDAAEKIALDGAGRLYIGSRSRSCLPERPGLIPFVVVRLRTS